MKKYDREKREWVSEDEYEARQKKRALCKGGREHDFVEVLPWGYEAMEGYQGDTSPVFEVEREIAEFTERKYAELETKGIKKTHKPWSPKHDYLSLACTVCKKRKTKTTNPKNKSN